MPSYPPFCTVQDLVGLDVSAAKATWTAAGFSASNFKAPGMNMFRMNGDKVAEVWTSFDDLGMMQQLGVIPTPG